MRIKRKLTVGILTAALVATVALTTPTAAVAAGAPIVSGTVTSDSNANGAIETGVAGVADKPIAGAIVELRCAADNAVLATATTGADGTYAFGDGDLGTCAGDVSLSIRTDSFLSGIYATEATSAQNDFARSTPSLATVPAFTPSATTPIVKNALLAPAWLSNLALSPDPDGWEGNAVKTGAAPFDASESEPGYDSSADNGLVRAGDAVTYTFSATFNSPDPIGASSSSAILEQTIHLNDGAVANFARIPAICTGTNPASTIKAMPSGATIQGGVVPPAGTTSIVLSCNLGAIGAERQALLPSTSVWVSPTSKNGSTFTTEARAYGVDANGVTTIRPSGSVENGPIQITSQPRYDLVKKQYTVSALTKTSINGVQTSGYFVYWHAYITTDRKVGVEAPQQPITFSEDFFGQYNTTSAAGTQGNTVSGLKYYLTQCIAAPDGAVYGNKASYPNNQNQSVSNSGTCSYTRDTANETSPYTVTVSGIDTTGTHYPTVDRNTGASLAAGPFYVAAYRLQIFVPLSEVDKATGAPNDGTGSLNVSNLVGDFDPSGVSGASNYGSGFEPGYCQDGTPTSEDTTLELDCATMEDGKRSNNVAGPMTITVSPGTWAKYNFDLPTGWVHSEKLLPGAAISHDGAATLQPGQTGASDIRIANGGANPMTGIMMCDVFDNTTMRLSTLDKVVDNAASFTGAYDLSTRHAYVLFNSGSSANNATTWASNLAYQDNWEIQYAHFDLSGDNPISGGFVNAYDRYNGDWTKQRAASCADGAAENTTGWVTSVAAAGGIDAVNGIRVVAKNGYGLDSAANAYFKIAYQQRDTFNGGPNADKKIPAGTVAANFARVRSDSYAPTWSNRAYTPMSAAGETGNSDGDRWTVTRAQMNLKKRSVTLDGVGTGAADFGNTGTAIAGNKVVWEVVSTLTADATDPAPVSNIVITDTLPKYAIYNEACTAALPGGTPPTSYTVNANGTTTLVWNLGTLTPNREIANRRICTDTDPLAPNGTTLTNLAVITSPDVTPVSVHKDDHTVVLEQTGELRLRKDVDQTLDLEDDNQQYTLRLKNFSDTLAVQKPTVIDVLPAAGDGSSAAGVNRDPASDYAGTSGLTGPVTAFDWSGTTPVPGTVYYTTVPNAQIPQDLNADTNPAIWSTTVANYAAVTGFKFVADRPLAVAGAGNSSGLVLKYATDQSDNDPGDLYANRFTAFSNTFKNGNAYQLLTSNQVTVRVVGFSLGDLIWTDENADGKFTAGTDTPAPAGVKVQVFRDGSSTPVATTTTNADGRWIVNDLSRGDYYVVIPASEFASGGLLAKRVASTVSSTDTPDSDGNEGVDHHAIAAGGGVRSAGLVHLDATVNGSVITGQEPAGDNVAGLRVSPGTTDDFTNLTADLALQRVPGYGFTKVADPVSGSAVVAGETVSYTLTGTNTGSAPLEVTVADDLAEVLAYAEGGALVAGSLAATIGADPAPTAPVLTGDQLSWSGTLTEGQSVVIHYQVVVAAGHEGETLRNTADSTATPDDSIGDPIESDEVSTSHPIPGYTFAKAAIPGNGTAVAAGGSLTYTLTGTNTGATALDPVTITDDLSAVLDHADVSSLQAVITGPGAPATAPAPTLSGTTLSWTGSLAIGQKVVVSYTATVDADANLHAATLTNAASSEATPPGREPLTGSGTTSNPVPGYTFTKTSDPVSGTSVRPGDIVTYTLTGSNTGATALAEVAISDDLSELMEHATQLGSATATIDGATGVPEPTLTGEELTWEGALEIGQTVIVSYQFRVDDDAEGVVLRNRAESQATGPDDIVLTPAPAETFHPTPGFTFVKTASLPTGTALEEGDSVSYTLTGTNSGQTALDPVVLKDDLSGVSPYAELDAASVVATIDGAPAAAPVVSGDTITWTGSLAVGQVVTITYTVTVQQGTASVDSVLVNRATASATPPTGEPIQPPEQSVSHPISGFEITKTSDPGPGTRLRAGDVVNYTVSAANTGAALLTGVEVRDDLSGVFRAAKLQGTPVATITHADGSETEEEPVLTGSQLLWTGELQAGERVDITYTVKVAEVAEDGVTLHNSASGSAIAPFSARKPEAPVTTDHPVQPVPPAANGLSATGAAGFGAGIGAAGLLLAALGALVIARRRRAHRG